jgi:hypothetical protein
MKMPQNSLTSLWSSFSTVDDLSARFLLSAEGNWALSDLIDGSALFGHADELRGRSVIIATTSQFLIIRLFQPTTSSGVVHSDWHPTSGGFAKATG